MGWKLTSAVVAAQAALFTLCVALTAAVLDEFARVPFYHSLTLAAVLAWGGTLIMLVRGRRGAVGLVLLAGLARTRPLRPRTQGARVTVRQPGAQAALRKVHSVVWGFPARRLAAGPHKQEAHVNYESRR